MALYSDRASIFHVYARDRAAGGDRVTQFARALGELNIDIICANSSQAKGRVERAHLTLQDRLVKELRLRGISCIEDANAYAPEFIDDYNRRFGREPASDHDAHRPVGDADLGVVFTWQETRNVTKNLVVHYKRCMYLLEDTPQTRPVRGKRIRVLERGDGGIELRDEHGASLPFVGFDKVGRVEPGATVANKRLGAALAHIQGKQAEREAELQAARNSRAGTRRSVENVWGRCSERVRTRAQVRVGRDPPWV